MALRSMTGFGASSRPWTEGGRAWVVSVELRAVNGRFLDVRVRQPFGAAVGSRVRGIVEQRLGRGRVELNITLQQPASPAAAEGVPVASEQLAGILAALQQIESIASASKISLSYPNGLELLRFLMKENGSVEGASQPPPWLDGVVAAALDDLVKRRTSEGDQLEEVLLGLVVELTDHLTQLKGAVAEAGERLLREVRARLEALNRALGAGTVEPERVAQEVAVLVMRGDVQEELDRLQAHLAHMRAIVNEAPHSGQGKTLDFLCQELFREVNTVGSKITSHEGSRLVIAAKSVVERMREQVQNVE